MALDPKTEAAIALHRFGFGPRAGSIAAIASDPRGALLAELERPGAGRITAAGLMTSGEAARAVFAFREAQRLAARSGREAAQKATRDTPPADAEMKATEPAPAAPRVQVPGLPQQIYLDEAKARFAAALAAELGF